MIKEIGYKTAVAAEEMKASYGMVNFLKKDSYVAK
jgi:hypothetical protein